MKRNIELSGYTGRTAEPPRAVIGTDTWMQEDFNDAFLQAITEEALKHNWQLVNLNLFEGRPPEGIQLDGVFMRSLPGTERTIQLEQFTSHMIRIGSAPHPDDHLLPAVLPDLVAQGDLSARHFAERGFARIGFVRRRPWSIWRNLYLGVENAAEETGLELELLTLPAFSTTEQSMASIAFKMFTDWIRQVPKPLGLVCPTDTFAAKLSAWARSAGVRVPTDVAMLGNGNNKALCERCLPRLSSVNTSEYERGVAACELMARLIAGKKPPREPVMVAPSGITVRESTDVLAAVNPTVAEALRFLWANITSDLSVDDVADHVGVHRRKLERAFRAEFGRGVNAELRRRRFERSSELLCETELTVSEVSLQSGFRSEDYFYRAFKRTFGTTPLQWRKAHRS